MAQAGKERNANDDMNEGLFTREGVYEVGIGGDVKKLAEYYSKTADNYEEFCDNLGYSGIQSFARIVERVQPNKEARILDVAAGTGLFGKKLKELGYSAIDALDASQGMLDRARSGGIYKSYICSMVLPDQKTQVPDNAYDVVCVCAGVTLGHISPKAVPELIRMATSGGAVIFGVDCHEEVVKNDPDFKQETIEANLQALVDTGKCTKWTKEVISFFISDDEHLPVYILNVA
ncbi:methyltransferase-like protein 27 [Amphiura filiformis]|uniref:methyltransferase-like protein 27 n=1 Tax=Amphiura filiformis TaxID=82378 RepID=UPI003B2229EB